MKNSSTNYRRKELPLSFKRVKIVAAMKNTIEIAIQKCYKQRVIGI